MDVRLTPSGAAGIVPRPSPAPFPSMSENEQTSLDFEAALEELEALVARMEEGDLPLEEALRQFERGIRLTRDCQRALREAEQKVDLLVEQAGDSETTPFDPES